MGHVRIGGIIAAMVLALLSIIVTSTVPLLAIAVLVLCVALLLT